MRRLGETVESGARKAAKKNRSLARFPKNHNDKTAGKKRLSGGKNPGEKSGKKKQNPKIFMLLFTKKSGTRKGGGRGPR